MALMVQNKVFGLKQWFKQCMELKQKEDQEIYLVATERRPYSMVYGGHYASSLDSIILNLEWTTYIVHVIMHNITRTRLLSLCII